jgi:hypothetical protein
MRQGSHVYFLKPVGMDGPVKIGCSTAPWDRMVSYAKWAPWPLELVAMIRGGLDLEGRLHAKFAHLQQHQEWFRADPIITATAAAINDGTLDIEALPAPKRITQKANWTPEAREDMSLSHRLNTLRRQGFDVPSEVHEALHRYRLSPEERSRRRAIVRTFVVAKEAEFKEAWAKRQTSTAAQGLAA